MIPNYSNTVSTNVSNELEKWKAQEAQGIPNDVQPDELEPNGGANGIFVTLLMQYHKIANCVFRPDMQRVVGFDFFSVFERRPVFFVVFNHVCMLKQESAHSIE